MNLKEICSEAVNLTKEVGNFLRTEAASFDLSKIEYKGHHNNLVSYVDKEAEKALVSRLANILPEAGFITEEETINKFSDELNWVIDPLDGTTNFMHGLPIFAISIGLVKKNKAILGIVYDVSRDECFYAWQGGGAYCNKEKLRISAAQSLKDSLMSTGFPYYDFAKSKEYLDIFNELMQKTHGLRRLGSAAIDIAYVAAGRFEGFFEYNLNAWDVAGGIALVEEAGGRVSDFAGGDNGIFGKSLIAGCSPTLHAELLEVVQRHWNQ
jgi:myo-inositol-1(or 4)-monophosphatase